MAASEAFKLLIENLQRMSRIDANVMINGEVGTGRRQCAVSIHKASSRADARFVTVNCTALNDHRFGIELFGLQNSAFEMVRKGAIFLAEEGTLYLHEVHELTLEMQAQLLRYLESGVFSPVGSNDVISSNVRIVCSTSANLKAYVEAGRFRNDLFHMLSQMVINTPTLNERIADIDLLAANVLREIAPGQPYQLDRLAYNRLLAHSFTGNLVELKNIMLRAISHSTSYLISETVMHQAINGGSVFSQAQDLQESVTRIEATLGDQESEESLNLGRPQERLENGLRGQTVATQEQPVEHPVDKDIPLKHSSRKGRWQTGSSSVNEATAASAMSEFASASLNTQIDDISKDPEATAFNEVTEREAYARRPATAVSSTPHASASVGRENLSMKDRELIFIKELMAKYHGNKEMVAKELGCTVRTLYRKLEKIKEKRL